MLAVMRVITFVAGVNLHKFLHIQFFFRGQVSILGVETTIQVIQWLNVHMDFVTIC